MSRKGKGKKKEEQVGGVTCSSPCLGGEVLAWQRTRTDNRKAAIACCSESLGSKLQWDVSRDLSAS